MTITIRLKTDNASFELDKEAEVIRLVSHWLNHTFGLNRLRGRKLDLLFDINGNAVGTAKVTGK
jgi:hypothetical protein